MDETLKIGISDCQDQVCYVRVQPLLSFFNPILPQWGTKKVQICCWGVFSPEN